MTDTTRNLLISLSSHMAYMQGQLEALHQLDDPDGHYWYRESVALRQKAADHLAALADEPAVPQSREPAAVTGRPSNEELLELWHGSDWYNEGATLREFCSIARAVLARWGNPAPQPAADGEVAELVRTMRMEVAAWNDNKSATYWLSGPEMARAAELLQRQALVPVSVSERLPGPEDCDAEGRCWFGIPGFDVWGANWVLRKRSHQRNGITSWLPGHALPLPEVDK